MPITTISFDAWVRKLQRDLAAKNVTFLVGAGVSMVSPTRLPSGHELKSTVVAAICSNPPLRRLWPAIRRNPRFRSITPEILFQRFYACLGEKEFTSFFEILRLANPNAVHAWLHSLCAARKCEILTTNFDVLIEEAGPTSIKVSHLHGELRKCHTMVTRINQVGRGLKPEARDSIRKRLSGRTLCVLGYSGIDNDIWLAIHLSRPKEILWLVRDSADWAMHNIPRFGLRHGVYVAAGDLSKLIGRFGGVSCKTSANSSALLKSRKSLVESWKNIPRLVDKYGSISELFFEIEDYRRAALISQEALRYARRTDLAGWFRIQASDALKVLGDFKKSEKYAEEAIPINIRLGDPFDIAGAYNSLGVFLVEKEHPEPRRGLKALQRAWSVIDALDLRSCTRHRRDAIRLFKGRVLNNLGLAHAENGAFRKALFFYIRCLKAKQRTGDLLGEAKTSGNLSIVYSHMGQFRRSTQWRKRAFQLMDKYSLKRDKAYVLRRLGVCLCENGRRQVGREFLMESLNLYREVGNPPFDCELVRAALAKFT